MHIDMMTMSAVSITVTAVLGFVLVFSWGRQGGSPFVGLWGLAMLLMSAGIVIASFASIDGRLGILSVGQTVMVLASAVMWHACRQFAHRHANLLFTLGAPIVFLLVANSGYFETFNSRVMIVCSLMAAFSFAAAAELSFANGEQLPSRWPTVAILMLTGLSFLSWLPLLAKMPIPDVGNVLLSSWFPTVILVTLLLRIALAFVVLSMAKERQEQEQRVDALTDSLTGLPNRRALFEAADAVGQRRILGGTPVSVLIFDLDHFEDTNDSFGHELGDDVLKVFAKTAAKHVNTTNIVGRLGGEEFAAILPGASLQEAVEVAETVRRSFCRSAAFVNGLAVGATVSVGVASDIKVDTDLSGLLRRADAALYVAKRAGRNRVAVLEADAELLLPCGSTVRTSPSRLRPTPPIIRHPVRTV